MAYNNIDGITVEQFNEIITGIYYQVEIHRMGDFKEVFHGDAMYAIRSAFNGGRYGCPQEQFNPNDEYFILNGYENIVSIPDYRLQEYIDIFKDEILEHVNENDIELDGVEEVKMKYSNIDGIGLGQFNEIMGELGYYDDQVYRMEDLTELFNIDAYDAIRMAFYGGKYGSNPDPFNPNDEYITFDGYGNLVSIPEYFLQDYLTEFQDEILEYVNDNNIYLYGVDEDDEDGYLYTGECEYLSELFEKTLDKY